MHLDRETESNTVEDPAYLDAVDHPQLAALAPHILLELGPALRGPDKIVRMKDIPQHHRHVLRPDIVVKPAPAQLLLNRMRTPAPAAAAASLGLGPRPHPCRGCPRRSRPRRSPAPGRGAAAVEFGFRDGHEARVSRAEWGLVEELDGKSDRRLLLIVQIECVWE